jgi:predicted dehydrogenase
MGRTAAPIGIGIIGCGRVSWERHHPALRRAPGFRVTAVCDKDPERAARAGALFGTRRALTDYRRLLELPQIDAVAVLTETGAHAETGLAAIEAGKHLFLEKPVALTLDEADRLIESHRRSGRVAQVCFNLRWHRLVARAKAALESGLTGQVKAIRSVYTHNRTGADAPDWHRRSRSGGGVSFNEGSPPLRPMAIPARAGGRAGAVDRPQLGGVRGRDLRHHGDARGRNCRVGGEQLPVGAE